MSIGPIHPYDLWKLDNGLDENEDEDEPREAEDDDG